MKKEKKKNKKPMTRAREDHQKRSQLMAGLQSVLASRGFTIVNADAKEKDEKKAVKMNKKAEAKKAEAKKAVKAAKKAEAKKAEAKKAVKKAETKKAKKKAKAFLDETRKAAKAAAKIADEKIKAAKMAAKKAKESFAEKTGKALRGSAVANTTAPKKEETFLQKVGRVITAPFKAIGAAIKAGWNALKNAFAPKPAMA